MERRQHTAPTAATGQHPKRVYPTNAARQAAYRARKADEATKREAERQRFAAIRPQAETVCIRAARLCHRAGLPAATLAEIAVSLDHLSRQNQTNGR